MGDDAALAGAPSGGVTAPRAARLADAEAVVALVHSAYRSDESRLGWTTESHLVGGQRVDAEMVRRLVADDDGAVLVLEDEDGLLACCHVERRPGTAHLGMFAVRPMRQGRGVGRRLLAAAEDQARAWGREVLELTVLEHRPELLAWYERRGFVLTGVRHPFPYGDERFGVPRRPDLTLLGMAKPLTTPSPGRTHG
ncbi:GNAT family N-acetyltransferase [Actinotalea sp. JY-7885]|uniref:GNAT family N-acetyltransferase n=1 Tax=Actinotalea sp. JY-7885 TaxID=2758576 RepID=UPI00165DC1DF|nr:GNAT family N-acetyltransferase [Actinotalea sp. JY-7885]